MIFPNFYVYFHFICMSILSHSYEHHMGKLNLGPLQEHLSAFNSLLTI